MNQFEITETNELGEHTSKLVSELEFRNWLRSQVGGKMMPSRIERYIDQRVMEEKIARR